MTEEQIKQKAQENAGSVSNFDLNITLMVAENKIDAYRLGRNDGFIDGYHECQKEHEWHDLRKDPNDLPKPTTPVLVILESGVPYVSWISSDKGWWFCTNYYTGEDKVIAWCEIPTFDKE